MVDRSFLFINFRSICTLSGAQTFWDTLYNIFASYFLYRQEKKNTFYAIVYLK